MDKEYGKVVCCCFCGSEEIEEIIIGNFKRIKCKKCGEVLDEIGKRVND